MIPYYVLVFVPVIIDLLRIKGFKPEVRRKVSLIVFFSILFFLVAFKGLSVGNDSNNYFYKFNLFGHASWQKVFTLTPEPAYNVLNKLVYLVSHNYLVFQIVAAVIIVLPIAIFYVKESEMPILTIALLLIQSNFTMFFSGYRQCIAVSLGIIAFEFVKRKKIIFFLLIVLLAYFFHNSAFMLLFLYPLYHIRIDRNRLFFVVPVVLAIYIFNRQILSWVKVLFSDVFDIKLHSTGAYMMLVLFLIFTVISFLFPSKDCDDKDLFGLRNYMILALVIQMFASLHPLAMRMGYYFTIFIPILIPKVIKSSVRWRQIAYVSAVIMSGFFIVYFFINTPSHNALGLYPYHFYWEGIK